MHGGAALHGRLRFRAPPGATLVVRGPLVLHGPLRARLAPPSGAAVVLGDCWLAEGVLRCGLLPLAPLPPSSQPMEAGGAAGSGGEAGALEAAEALAGAFCELHGASAADEVRILVVPWNPHGNTPRPPLATSRPPLPTPRLHRSTHVPYSRACVAPQVERAAGEACALELGEGSTLTLEEGASLWVDGSSGVEPSTRRAGGAGVAAEAKAEEAAAVVVCGGKDARLELVGRARLELSAAALLAPAQPRVLAQVVHG